MTQYVVQEGQDDPVQVLWKTLKTRVLLKSRATALGCRHLCGRSQVFNLSGVIIKLIHTTWFVRLSCWSHQTPSVKNSG